MKLSLFAGNCSKSFAWSLQFIILYFLNIPLEFMLCWNNGKCFLYEGDKGNRFKLLELHVEIKKGIFFIFLFFLFFQNGAFFNFLNNYFFRIKKILILLIEFSYLMLDFSATVQTPGWTKGYNFKQFLQWLEGFEVGFEYLLI